ncbi:3-isopropylmalate dehydratase large subunit [Pseudochelatococcus lubricantis]|uniref:3-isopropylmalate dehydratase large subunit n=1 Tax=Pseudochelatococcus lubricantis TaxID=1538102 RepID=UPI0035E7F90C
MPKTLYDKIWAARRVCDRADGAVLLYIDRHYVHEGSFKAFDMLRDAGLALHRPDLTVGVADHYVPSIGRSLGDVEDAGIRGVIGKFNRNVDEFGLHAYRMDDPHQGIVHVVGPEQGLSLPGMTIVCGDSHTSTHGALGALAFGIGASEACQVLATQTLWQKKSRSLLIRVDGTLRSGVVAKDIILRTIQQIGTSGAAGHTIEYAGAAIRALSMQARMTICNMSIEAGARAGLIAPDDTTFEWIAGRPFAPTGAEWDRYLARWQGLPGDADAVHDRVFELDAEQLEPMVTWGTAPDQGGFVTGHVPDPAASASAAERETVAAALAYMDLTPGTPLQGLPIQQIFIGSCTNGRLEDLRIAAAMLKGRHIAPGVTGTVVPGSESVRREAEALGLDRIFMQAGMRWGHAGCSMCVGMNGDIVAEGQRCVSTTNRNFVGRQGKGARTHLASPATAAASAITGRITDPRQFAEAV